jgi:membrane protein implicated in regulation of membrane protease activity
MADSTIWWLLAGTAVGIELVIGTFYLLMLALGLSAAAISAHMGASSTLQIVIAAVLGSGPVLAWRRYKQSQPPSAPASANHDVNMDVGETVHVASWNSDGTSTVKYRGANWAVSSAGEAPLVTGLHRIVEVVGSRLVVSKL